MLIKKLISWKYLKTPTIIEAFKKVERKHFVLSNYEKEAHEDYPLPIGYGQTISQPLTVAFMLELLQPKRNDKILDVGSGSGWQTALLAYIVGTEGKVYAVEVIPELYEFGKRNVEKLGFKNVEFYLEDGSTGLADKEPFDKIIVAAAAPEIPKTLLKQLKKGGRLVIPIGRFTQEIVLIEKINDKEYKEKRYSNFAFVPLLGREGF